MAKLRDYLELARISNLPTVWSNVLMGVVLGQHAAGGSPPDSFIAYLRVAAPLMGAVSLLYIGGMVQNDAVDAAIDAQSDLGRPIPSGRVPRHRAFTLAYALLLAGLLWITGRYGSVVGSSAGVLVLAIWVYNRFHHRVAVSRLLMGACRGLVVITAALAAISPAPIHLEPTVVGAALALMAYTWLISALAARESLHGDTRRKLVMGMIAAMPLLDAAILLFLWQWPVAIVCALCAPLTALAHRRVAGT